MCERKKSEIESKVGRKEIEIVALYREKGNKEDKTNADLGGILRVGVLHEGRNMVNIGGKRDKSGTQCTHATII
ncbi:hypothetical protein FRX31_024999 [Thalictrum thalictroides]|uniref:Uncharacterized protein n=1 Tax=Thalictrum thalictroides TaxID=46969 RepID=A0A7J6VL12_THATH|nr:hypothetical protein FRX31_024999 [Thalictrum thalictroides]